MKTIEQQLLKTQADLANLEAEYKEFVHIVSHDLSAPFRTTSGVINILLNKNNDIFDDITKQHLNIVLKELDNGSASLNALLDYSRINTQAKPFEIFNSHEVCQDAISALSEHIRDLNATIKIADLPEINADKQQIKLVFHHLLKNALMYCQPNTALNILVSAQVNDDSVEFSVKDNGTGIKAKHFDKIFKVLRRAVTKSASEGYGMGLAIAKKIVQRHGGNIRVESNEGEGTIIYFTIRRTT